MAQQVEHAVQHQDLDFVLDGVAEFARLRAGAASGDGDVAEEGRSLTLAARTGKESTSVA